MWRDSRDGYGLWSILLHWSGAILVVAIWWLGNIIDDAPRGAARAAAQDLHYSVAVVAMIILVPRLVWRLANFRTPLVATAVPWLDLAAKIVKWALLLAILILLVTGPIYALSSRRAVLNVFGFVIQSPFAPETAALIHKIVEPIHVLTSKVIFALVVVHVLGALKHVIFDRDGVLKRMLRPVQSDA